MDQASDLSETINKVGVVFGPASEIVIKQAEQMADKFGLNKVVMLDAAANIGLLGKASGYSMEQAAGLGNNMAKLAADASSFYNVPLDVALEKIRSGLSGEAEPMRSFGVLLNEAAVKTEAYRLGLAKTGAELTEGQKVQARASLIMRGMTDATGDLERTQGGFANQLRQVQGNLQNLAATMGASLLPPLNSMLQLFNEIGAGGAGSLTTAFETIGSYLPTFASFSGIIEGLGLAYRNWGDVVELTGVSIAEWFTNLGEYAVYFKDRVLDAFEAFAGIGGNLIKNLGSLLAEVWDYLTSFGKDPIEVHFVPLLEGVSEGKAKLSLSDFGEQRAAIADRMAAREAERLAIKSKGPAGAFEDSFAAATEREGTAKGEKKFTSQSLSGSELASAAIKSTLETSKDKIPEKQLTEAQQTNKHLENLVSRKEKDYGKFLAAFG